MSRGDEHDRLLEGDPVVILDRMVAAEKRVARMVGEIDWVITQMETASLSSAQIVRHLREAMEP